jgi:hypothetical protein
VTLFTRETSGWEVRSWWPNLRSGTKGEEGGDAPRPDGTPESREAASGGVARRMEEARRSTEVGEDRKGRAFSSLI